MFAELFDPLYAPIPDAQKYLKRIGFGTFEKADRETLDAIILAHQRNVPFENIDIYDVDADISIAVEDLYDKVVVRRRGGYCFELNAVLGALLKALGYEVNDVSVRVVWGFTRAMPFTHRGVIVTIDGVRYFCDVGFGGPSPQGSIALDDTNPQQAGPSQFVVTKNNCGEFVINRVVEDGLEATLAFLATPVDPVDFLAPNFWQSKNSYSMFRVARLCNLITETGVVTLSGNVLKIHDGSEVTEQTLETEAQIRTALKEHFGIEGDFSLKI